MLEVRAARAVDGGQKEDVAVGLVLEAAEGFLLIDVIAVAERALDAVLCQSLCQEPQNVPPHGEDFPRKGDGWAAIGNQGEQTRRT